MRVRLFFVPVLLFALAGSGLAQVDHPFNGALSIPFCPCDLYGRVSLLSSGRIILPTNRQSHSFAWACGGASWRRETEASCWCNFDF